MPDFENHESFYQELDNYFKIKSKYEKEYAKNKRTILGNTSLTLKQKRTEIRRLQPKCIRCKNPSGTIFSNGYSFSNSGSAHDLETRFVKMVCGNKLSPCSLNVTIRIPSAHDLRTTLRDEDESLVDLKRQMIIIKNQQIFNSITDRTAVESFGKIKENISDAYTFHTNMLKDYLNVTENEETIKKINTKMIEVNESKKEIKENLLLFGRTNESQYLKTAVRKHIDSYMPRMEDLMNLKYKSVFVEYNETDGTHHLRQHKTNFSDLEFYTGSPIVEKQEKKIMRSVSDDIKSKVKPTRHTDNLNDDWSTSDDKNPNGHTGKLNIDWGSSDNENSSVIESDEDE